MTEHLALSERKGYRSEIDGLRALAVMAVFIFHINPHLMPGGFVGVDVFFVLSGYLITGLLRRAAQDQTFRYGRFFLRRVRRLTPALFFVVLCSCVMAYFVLMPQDMVPFGKSVIAQPLALQNMHFLSEGQYFHGSTRKVLLHTWSLGIEEQFYFVWPFLILLLSKRSRKVLLCGIIGMILLSFGLSWFAPTLSAKLSFFAFPMRAWELGLGGLLAIWEETSRPNTDSTKGSKWGLSLLATLSLGAIIWSFFFISEDDLFPGWIALVPVIATVGLIATATRGEALVSRVLSIKGLTFIGLLSYSLYLWHWPVIVFARFLKFDPATWSVAPLLFGLSFVLSLGSYYGIEQPVRYRKILPTTRALLTTMGVAAIAMISFGITALATEGMVWRYPKSTRPFLVATFHKAGKVRCDIVSRVTHPFDEICEVVEGDKASPRKILLWGNSHAGMWKGVISDLATSSKQSFYLNVKNCRATTDSRFCNAKVQNRILRHIKEEGITDVILASTWHGAYNVPDEVFEQQLETLVGQLVELNVRIWPVISTPTDETFAPQQRYDSMNGAPTFASIPVAKYEKARRQNMEYFQQMAGKFKGVQPIDLKSAFCSDQDMCKSGEGDHSWYYDAAHISSFGALNTRSLFAPVFEP